MKPESLETVTVEEIQEQISQAENTASSMKLELLRHYLVNFILYTNLDDECKEDSPIREKLLKIAILLEKLVAMENKIQMIDPRRVLDERMLKKKNRESKKSTPGKKFRINSENQRERTKLKEDYNIKVKNKKMNSK